MGASEWAPPLMMFIMGTGTLSRLGQHQINDGSVSRRTRQKFCTTQWFDLTGLSHRSALKLTSSPKASIPTHPGQGNMSSFTLKQHEIAVNEIHRNLPPSTLYEHAILYEKDAHIAKNGALVAYSGVKPGRSPKDKRVVNQSPSKDEVWWGSVNIPLEPEIFAINRERARDYLNSRERLYCFDGFAGWDTKYRIKVRVICSRPYHALFMHTMLIRPTKEELENFGAPEFVIYNAGAFPANRLTSGTGSKTSVGRNLENKGIALL